MTIVNQGSSAIIDVAIGQKIAVSTPGEAYVDIIAGALGAGYTSKRLADNVREQTFGPYGCVTRLQIRAIAGETTFGEPPEQTTAGSAVASVNDKTGNVQLTAADIGALPAPPSYHAGAVQFNKDTSQLINAALACSDSRWLSFSYWVKATFLDGDMAIWCADPENQNVFCDFDLPTGIRTTIGNATANDSFRFYALADNDTVLSRFCHVMGTLEVFDNMVRVAALINGQPSLSVTLTNTTGYNIPLNGKPFILGDATPQYGETGANMLLADFWFAPGVSLFENGIVPQATVRKFIDANGYPVDLGANGELPTGTQPAIYLHLPKGAAVSDFAINRGTGGDFSLIGALGIAPVSPTDSPAGFPNPMTATGDLIIGGTDGAATRLANPGAGTFNLQSVDGVLTWAAV